MGQRVADRNDTASLVLDRDVALVLFDFLARVVDEEEGEPLADALADPAELHALLSLFADLEEALTEPSQDDYAQRVEAARARVLQKFGRPR